MAIDREFLYVHRSPDLLQAPPDLPKSSSEHPKPSPGSIWEHLGESSSKALFFIDFHTTVNEIVQKAFKRNISKYV